MPAPQLGFSQSLPCFCLKCPDSYPPLVPSDGRKFPVGEIARVQLRKLNLPYSGNLIWGYVAGISCNGGHHGGSYPQITQNLPISETGAGAEGRSRNDEISVPACSCPVYRACFLVFWFSSA